jgi:hypothetical protein
MGTGIWMMMMLTSFAHYSVLDGKTRKKGYLKSQPGKDKELYFKYLCQVVFSVVIFLLEIGSILKAVDG